MCEESICDLVSTDGVKAQTDAFNECAKLICELAGSYYTDVSGILQREFGVQRLAYLPLPKAPLLMARLRDFKIRRAPLRISEAAIESVLGNRAWLHVSYSDGSHWREPMRQEQADEVLRVLRAGHIYLGEKPSSPAAG